MVKISARHLDSVW